MTPAILLLLGVGPILWIAVINPRTVTDLLPRAMALPILAPTLVGAIWALIRGTVSTPNPTVHAVQVSLVILSALTVATAWTLFLRRQYLWARITAAAATLIVILAGSHLLHDEIMLREVKGTVYSKLNLMVLQTALCAFLPIVTGIVPILLLSAAQGWTKSLNRLTPCLYVTRPLLVVPFLAIQFVYGGVRFGWVYLGIAALISALPILAISVRRSHSLRTNRLLLASWPLTIAAGAFAVLSLASASTPW